MSKYAKYDEEIIRLNKKGLDNAFIAKTLGIDSRRVSDRLIKNNLKSCHNYSNELITIKDDVVNNVLIGTIIGDGCIFKSRLNVHYRMNLAHSLKQSEYFMFKYEILKDIVKSEHKKYSQFDSRTGKIYSHIKLQSRTNPLFTNLYNEWYKDGKKIISYDNIIDMGELCFAIKYFDDGHKSSNGCGYCIAMHKFDKSSVKAFRRWIFEKFDIETTVQRNSIYIPKKSFITAQEIFKKYATSDLFYKVI